MEKEIKKIFYNLSKDYELLYEKICDGNEVACFVNYNLRGFEDTHPPCRDICVIKRRKAYDIDFLARGISYGSVSDYWKDTNTEKEVFLTECERMCVDWIDNTEENIPEDFNEALLLDSEKVVIYEKGREHESTTTLKWIKEWDGSTNSGMGQILLEKYNQLFSKKTYSEEQVIRIVACFSKSYDTGKMFSGDENIEYAIEEVKSMIDLNP